MAIQFGVLVRNARLDAIETTVGTAPVLRIYTGAQPADCATAASGTQLVTMSLPSDWLATAASGSKAIAGGPWSGSGGAAGSAGYFRIWNTAVSVCHMQGSITATGGGGDMTLDNISIAVSQAVAVNTFTLTDGNA